MGNAAEKDFTIVLVHEDGCKKPPFLFRTEAERDNFLEKNHQEFEIMQLLGWTIKLG